MQMKSAKNNIAKWLILFLFLTIVSFLFLSRTALTTAIFAGAFVVLINLFLLSLAVEKLFAEASPLAFKDFWKNFPFRLLVAIVLFYLFLCIIKVNVIYFLIGMVAVFPITMIILIQSNSAAKNAPS